MQLPLKHWRRQSTKNKPLEKAVHQKQTLEVKPEGDEATVRLSFNPMHVNTQQTESIAYLTLTCALLRGASLLFYA